MVLDAYTIAQLQQLAALTQAAEAEGVVDLPTLRLRLHEHLRQRALAMRVEHGGLKKQARRQPPPPTPCPSCGSLRTKPIIVDGLELLGCWDCRYSTIIGGGA